jgi:hypothetical protein
MMVLGSGPMHSCTAYSVYDTCYILLWIATDSKTFCFAVVDFVWHTCAPGPGRAAVLTQGLQRLQHMCALDFVT